MLEHFLIEHCSPTLARIKTANLFNYTYSSQQELQAYLDYYGPLLSAKGVKMEILQQGPKKALIYVYRPDCLRVDLDRPGVRRFLQKQGYQDWDCDGCLAYLKERIASSREFPHEIGLFLGYPLGDVVGFIVNEGQNSKCVGCWKVYCNACEAQKTFAKYDKCKKVYRQLFQDGRSLECLTVAAS